MSNPVKFGFKATLGAFAANVAIGVAFLASVFLLCALIGYFGT